MYNCMIFFSVWLYVCSREVLRELFQLPNNIYYNNQWSCFDHLITSTTIGILGILGILVFPLPPVAGLLALTSSLPHIQHNEPKPETPATLRPAADLPRPSADGSQRPGYAPPHNPPRRTGFIYGIIP